MKIQPISLLFYLVALSLFLTSACRTHGPAFSANADPYMAKPVYRGENSGAFYLSGRLNKGYEYYADEKNHSNELSAHLSFMSQYFYISGGFSGYWGKYKVNGAINPVTGDSRLPFNGGGGRIEMGGRIPLENNFDVLLGFSGELFSEGGKFTEYSRDSFEYFTLGLSRIHFNVAPAMDLRYAPPGKWDFGMRYSLDSYISFSDLVNNSRNSYLHRFTLHLTYNRVTAYGQIGLTPDNQQVLSLGMAYGIPFRKEKKEVK